MMSVLRPGHCVTVRVSWLSWLVSWAFRARRRAKQAGVIQNTGMSGWIRLLRSKPPNWTNQHIITLIKGSGRIDLRVEHLCTGTTTPTLFPSFQRAQLSLASRKHYVGFDVWSVQKPHFIFMLTSHTMCNKCLFNAEFSGCRFHIGIPCIYTVLLHETVGVKRLHL